MRTVTRFAAIVGLTMLLCGCGGSAAAAATASPTAKSSAAPDCGRNTTRRPRRRQPRAPIPLRQCRCAAVARSAFVSGGLSLRGRSDRHLRCGDPIGCAGLCVLGDELPAAAGAGRAMSGWLRMHGRRTTTARTGRRRTVGRLPAVAANECVDDAGCAAKVRHAPSAPTDRCIARMRCMNGACAAEFEPCGDTDVMRRHHRHDVSAGLRVRRRSQRHVHARQRCRLSGHLPAGSRRRVYQ